MISALAFKYTRAAYSREGRSISVQLGQRKAKKKKVIRALIYSQASVSLQSFEETRGQSKKSSVIFVQLTLIQFVLQNENRAPLGPIIRGGQSVQTTQARGPGKDWSVRCAENRCAANLE